MKRSASSLVKKFGVESALFWVWTRCGGLSSKTITLSTLLHLIMIVSSSSRCLDFLRCKHSFTHLVRFDAISRFELDTITPNSGFSHTLCVIDRLYPD